MGKVKASFSYTYTNGVVRIVDNDAGDISVTNDIENIVEFIAKVEGMDPKVNLWVYQDSNGVWDGWDPVRNKFILVDAPFAEHAIEAVRTRLYFLNGIKSSSGC